MNEFTPSAAERAFKFSLFSKAKINHDASCTLQTQMKKNTPHTRAPVGGARAEMRTSFPAASSMRRAKKNKCLPTISRPRLLSGRANNIAAGTNPCARSLAFCLSKKQQIRTKVGNLIFYIKCHTQPHNARHKVYIEQRAPLSEFIFSCTTLSFVARKLQLLLGADNIAFFCTRRAAINLTRYEKTQ